MTETAVPGRHRAAGRHNPLTEITGMIARVGENGVKASAVVAASGGLVAAFALPAQAATTSVQATPQTASLLGTSAKGTAFAPATLTALVAPAAKPAAAAAIAPAVVAPAAAAPAATVSVGVLGFEGVEKPAPPPPPPAPVVEAASRSDVRTSVGTTQAAAPAAPAPAVNVAASVGGGVLGIAAAYSGIWYVYGGNTPAGFDCSGFTQFVFGQAGISLPRTAQDQKNFATPVSNPQPGDLVFFGSGYAYHVGIYAGNGMMYDSPRTGAQSGLHAIWTSDVTYGRV